MTSMTSMTSVTSMTRDQQWQSRTEGLMSFAALAFLLAYAVPIAVPGVSDTVRAACSAVMTVTWVAFGFDYALRLWLAPSRRRFVRTNLLDLAAIVLPFLRPLRLLRLVVLLSILNRAGSHTLRGRVVTYMTGGTMLLIIIGALAITDAERGRPGATIANLGDGLWWAATTITTVGYGDHFPVTTQGRFVAVALMIGGIALLGVVTATFASWLVERVAEGSAADQSATRAQVDALADEIRAFRTELRTRPGGGEIGSSVTHDPPA